MMSKDPLLVSYMPLSVGTKVLNARVDSFAVLVAVSDHWRILATFKFKKLQSDLKHADQNVINRLICMHKSSPFVVDS